jgi:hypothetical protein
MSPFAVGAIAGMGGCSLLLLIVFTQITTARKKLQRKLESELHELVSGNRIRSDIAAAFDDFVRNRLAKEMPVLAMFLDEALIAELNAVFNRELDTRLPDLLEKAVPGKTALTPLWVKLWKHWLAVASIAWLAGVLITAMITVLLC